MFLLTEEFMRRYKDRWIIGAYDCINEPISMTPRREELTPKLVYFYEKMIRRCRKIDQKHLCFSCQRSPYLPGTEDLPVDGRDRRKK